MLFKLTRLPVLIFLLVLLPQAQSSRLRFVALRGQHSHPHGQHHQATSSSQSSSLRSSHLHELPKPHIQMVIGANVKLSQYAKSDIAVQPHHQVPDWLGGILDMPVSGTYPGGMSESVASSSRQTSLGDMAMVTMLQHHPIAELGGMLDTPVSGPNPGGNSESLTVSNGESVVGEMLDTPVSGPNPGGNSESLLVSFPNLGLGSKLDNMLYSPVSGPNLRGNSAIPGDMLEIPASGQNPGGNSAVLGSILSKTSAPLGTSAALFMSKNSESGTLFGRLPRTPVPPSGPSPIHNSMVANQGLFVARKYERVHRV